MMALVYWWGWELAHPAVLATEAAIVLLGAVGALTGWLMDRPEPAAPLTGRRHMLPIRGDAQEREGGCAPAESRPAAGAGLTGLLSPRPCQEGAPPVSAPPAGPARLATLAERDWWLTPDDVARRHARDCDNLRHAAHLALDNLTATIQAGEKP